MMTSRPSRYCASCSLSNPGGALTGTGPPAGHVHAQQRGPRDAGAVAAGDWRRARFRGIHQSCHSAPGLRLVLRRLSAKSIGRLLARADGVPIDGWLVERCGVEINVALWHVVSVSHRLESGTGFGQSGAINLGAT